MQNWGYNSIKGITSALITGSVIRIDFVANGESIPTSWPRLAAEHMRVMKKLVVTSTYLEVVLKRDI